MIEQKPLVSVIVVNFNGRVFLYNCIKAVLKNNYPEVEIIVVDNGSTDESVDYINKEFANLKNLKLVQLDDNFGPAYARNVGIKNSNGKYLAFLDNDTVPEYNWITSAVEVMENDSTIGVGQCKILLRNHSKRLDYVGDYLSQYGFLIQQAETNELDNGQYDSYSEIFSAKSAAMIARKDVCDKIGGFDPSYFIYVEETDLCWRIWLAGYKVILIPESRVYHEFSSSVVALGEKQNYFSKFHGCKNYITTLIKNLEVKNMIKIVPFHVSFWVAMSIWLFFHMQFKSAGFIIKGIFWVILNIGSILKKRKKIQDSRVITDKDLFPRIMRNRPLSYFYRKLSADKRVRYDQSFRKPASK